MLGGMRDALARFPAVDRGPWVRRFGEDSSSWNVDPGPIGFNPGSGAEPMFDDEEDDERDGDGSGFPGRGLVVDALDTFARCWGDFDEETAARIFNLPIELVDDAAPVRPGGVEPVSIDALSTAVQVLSACRSSWGTSTVEDVAAMLNQSPERVVEAVEAHCWMFIGGDDVDGRTIEHEGE